MNNNLVEIQLEIDKLQKQAQLIKAKEFAKTVREIRQKMHLYGITVKDLQTEKSSGTQLINNVVVNKVKKTVAKSARVPVAVKYRGANGESWTGRGLMPKWLKTLVEQGRSKQEFLIT